MLFLKFEIAPASPSATIAMIVLNFIFIPVKNISIDWVGYDWMLSTIASRAYRASFQLAHRRSFTPRSHYSINKYWILNFSCIIWQGNLYWKHFLLVFCHGQTLKKYNGEGRHRQWKIMSIMMKKMIKELIHKVGNEEETPKEWWRTTPVKIIYHWWCRGEKILHLVAL